MKEKRLHEGCIEQMYRLMHDRLGNGADIPVDKDRLIRMDDYEMKEEVQKEVFNLWQNVSKDNIKDIADINGYWDEFYEIFGFLLVLNAFQKVHLGLYTHCLLLCLDLIKKRNHYLLSLNSLSPCTPVTF